MDTRNGNMWHNPRIQYEHYTKLMDLDFIKMGSSQNGLLVMIRLINELIMSQITRCGWGKWCTQEVNRAFGDGVWKHIKCD